MDLTNRSAPPLLVFATKGTGSNEESRIKTLASRLPFKLLLFDKKRKLQSFCGLMREFYRSEKTLIVMEGTGIAGGLACMLGRLIFGHRYVVSSGDAVGPFVGAHVAILGAPFTCYERLLCQLSAGFIGWTPYLVGRAITYGAPRGMTAPGWVIGKSIDEVSSARKLVRAKWGINDDTIVFGLAGAIVWSKRRSYCYGLELVRAIRKVRRDDIAVVVIGDGSGLDVLKQEAGVDLGKRIFLPGSVPLDQVMEILCGFDVASLPQSTDAVGAFRYTTKISEYRAIDLPIVTLQIPASYDLDLGNCWRLPGQNPWDPKFIEAMAGLMQRIRKDELVRYRCLDKCLDLVFDRDTQVARATEFLTDMLSTVKQ
jgi:hypothetical protein